MAVCASRGERPEARSRAPAAAVWCSRSRVRSFTGPAERPATAILHYSWSTGLLPATAYSTRPHSSRDVNNTPFEMGTLSPGPCSSVLFRVVRVGSDKSCEKRLPIDRSFHHLRVPWTFSNLRRSIHFIRIPTTSAMTSGLHRSVDARVCAHCRRIRHRGQPGAGRGRRVVRAAGIYRGGAAGRQRS